MKNLIPLELHSIAINEGVMSEIDIMAQEARNVKEFIKEFMAEYGDKVKDNAETRKWLESMYNDAVNEKSKGLWANIHAKRKKGKKPARKGSKAYKKAKAAADKLNNESVDLDIDSLNSKELKEISVSIENFKLLSRNEQDLFLKNYSAILPSNMVSILKSYRVDEAFIGPFVFNDKMSDDELKDMYDAALDGYANYSKGFEHPKSKYKQAYQAIEKILKKRGVSVDESEKPRFKKRDRIEYRLTHQGGVGKYANAISQSDHVETGVIAKRTRTLAGFKYMLTTGLELSDHEILGLAESVTEGFHTFKGEMARDLKEKGVKLKKGDKVDLEIQPNNYVIYGPNRKQVVLDKRDFEGKIDQYVIYESLNEKKAPFPYNLGYNGRNDHFKYAEEIGMAVKDIEGIRDYHKMAQRGGKTAVQDLSSRILITTIGQPEIKDAIVKALKGVDDNIDLKTIKSNYDAPDRERSKHEQDNDMWKWEIQKKEDFHSYKRKYGDAPKPDREFTRDHQMEFIDMLAPYSTTQHQLADIDITSLKDFLQYAADHVSPANLKKVTKRIKKEYPKLESVQVSEAKGFAFPNSFEVKKTISYVSWGVDSDKLFKGTYVKDKILSDEAKGEGVYINHKAKAEITLDQDDFTNFERLGNIVESVNEKKSWTLVRPGKGYVRKIAVNDYTKRQEQAAKWKDIKSATKAGKEFTKYHGVDVKVQAIDESVNEKKQLPKEILKHKDIPSWARYVAQQSDGEWTWYEDTPTMTKWKGGGAWKQDGNQTYTGVKTDGKDWDKMPTYYYVKNGKISESTNVLTLESFLNETLPTQEIDPDKFPDQWQKDKQFFRQGYKDGSNVDDTVETKPVKIPASQLKPSQDAVYLGKALGMAIGGVEGGSLDAIISSDNRILDGHHRWAATIFNNPKARVGGVQAQLKIGDLIPVLRQAGDALGNNRGLPPKGGDVNIFKATLQDVRDAVYDGKHMNPQFYNREQAVEWFERTGEKKIQNSLNLLQRVGPPAGAPPRAEMPKVEPEQVKNVANKLAGGAIDVRKPYVGDPVVKGKGGLQNYLK